MKILSTLALTLLLLSSAFASDQCESHIEFDNIRQSQNLRDQHLIILHSSVRNESESVAVEYLNQFFREFCKMPYSHRTTISNHQLEIHLMIGSIAQHEVIQRLVQRGVTPRGHSDTWANLPGVAGVAGRNDAGGASPALFNIASLYENHGSKNLVLHEMGHTLDHFLYKRGSQKIMISAQRDFGEIMDQSPWEAIYMSTQRQEYFSIEEVPELDLSIFASSPPSIRAIYEEQARNTYQMQIANRQDLIEKNEIITQNNIKMEQSDRDQMRYHQQHEEEHFAELYARWYDSEESRYEIYSLIPELNNYFPGL